MMYDLATSLVVADPREAYMGALSSQCVEHIFGLFARLSHGDISLVNMSNTAQRAIGFQVLCHELGIDSTQPGRLRKSGAILPAVESVDETRCFTIGQGLEMALEILEFSIGGHEIEWQEVFGVTRPPRFFHTLDDVLSVLPKPKAEEPHEVLSTEDLDRLREHPEREPSGRSLHFRRRRVSRAESLPGGIVLGFAARWVAGPNTYRMMPKYPAWIVVSVH
jgi:hypothetical protein